MVLIDPKNMYSSKGPQSKHNSSFEWDIVHEEGREVISSWRDKRLRVQGARRAYHEFLVHSFDLDLLKSFFQNINFMVVIQMTLAVIAVYLFQVFEISFDVHIGLFVSPIVFPLAFSINTDFQRREKVLEDLAVFKSSGMVWYFCMREWKQAAKLDNDWITAVHGKLKSLLFHLREYLLTCKPERRKVILRAMYEDFSDTNQLIERVRASELPSNTAVISRSIHLLNMMCLSFERLRVVREYRSPRSIRSFNKVFIMFLPIILAPYFVYLGIKSNNRWEPYYIAVLVAFVFSALQGVQDKLDDPFDGMSEDDIDLDTIDEWTFGSLEHTMKRSFDIGRFKVTVEPGEDTKSPIASRMCPSDKLKRKSSFTHSLLRPPAKESVAVKEDHPEIQKMAQYLEGIPGNTRITRKSLYRKSSQLDADGQSNSKDGPLDTIFEPIAINNIDLIQGQPDRKVTFMDENLISPNSESLSFMSYETESVCDHISPQFPRNPPEKFVDNVIDIENNENVIDFIKTSTDTNDYNAEQLSNIELQNKNSEELTKEHVPCFRNRFNVKLSSKKDSIPNRSPEIDGDNYEKEANPYFQVANKEHNGKFNVISVDKLKDLISLNENKKDEDLVCSTTDEIVNICDDKSTNISADCDNTLLSILYDSSLLIDLPETIEPSESIDLPTVSFINSTSNLNNVPSSEMDSKNSVVLRSVIDRKNYASLTSVDDYEDEQLMKKISSAI